MCDANLDVRDSVRDLVTPLARRMSAGGIAIITLKLGRRVGKHGIERNIAKRNLENENGYLQKEIGYKIGLRFN